MDGSFKNQLPREYKHVVGLYELVKDLGPMLGLEIGEDRFYIFANPHKGDPDEEKSLDMMEEIPSLVRTFGLSPEPLYRNTPKGDRIDGVRVLLPVVLLGNVEVSITTSRTVH